MAIRLFDRLRTPPPPSSVATSLDLSKLGRALRGAVGRRIGSVFLTRYSDERYRIHLVFSDGMHYEIYGTGMISGARDIEPGDVNELRRVLADDAALEVIELSPETLRNQ